MCSTGGPQLGNRPPRGREPNNAAQLFSIRACWQPSGESVPSDGTRSE